ncbi:amidohydrolase [Veillonella rodentium]|uniref:Peptidase M20 domain-containing protein 2 n=1 Tax=Veillonella rodentium TaxID=248315 RepID=A0A239YM36_9FIRM|nr:amidohydrolase [Veillonella rodentium]SNV59800.1 Aminobenzoyl-glutamate utilization protein B [Veillonella rodentium]
MTLQEREAQACAIIDNLQDELKAISLFLHDNPELGQAEFKALEKISQYMTDKGFITQVGLTGRPELRTAMRSDKNIERNHKMAFLGEYDALPELGHGCGHNLIAIMSMGAAIAFSQTCDERWGTTFFGCPAEETIGGKVFMAEEHLFDGYEGALIIHPGGENEVGGTSLATHPLEVTFYGRSCHIASLTDSGVNALDCAVDLYQSIKRMKAEQFPKGVIVGIIFTEAGAAPNVVTDTATLRMTVRGRTVDDLEHIILPAIKAEAKEIAEHYGARVEMHHYEPLFKDMRQDKMLLELFDEVMTEFGERPRRLPDDEADGSTDVGNVSYEVPTAQPTLQIGLGLEAHTPEFTCASGSEYGLDQAIKGAKIMAVVALRYAMSKF